MDKPGDQNNELLSKLSELEKKQESLSGEIRDLKIRVYNVQYPDGLEKEPLPVEPIISEKKEPLILSETEKPFAFKKIKKPPNQFLSNIFEKLNPPGVKQNIEKFVGENLISVIGVIILIIGVGIGVKYAIDHKMISPLTRIITGYLIAIGLLVFAIKLKSKYESYSAVLLSGALAIMYFLTFAAYDFYELIPKLMAFGLMVVLTVFTTFASIQYNKQVIAHIGFVGAYAVPFLLSDGSGNVEMLFSYIAVINLGTLSVSLKKYWKSLYYTAFLFTWLIFIAGGENLDATDNLGVLLTFLAIYYLTFYAVFIGYKLINKEIFKRLDVVLLLANSFVFYGLGYAILSDVNFENNYLGLFTIINAVTHFGIGVYINKQKLADKNLFYLIIGLVLTFITIAIPVQLNGHWVTLLWIGEATLLFWIGRSKQIVMYEKLSYPLILLAFFSLFQDWESAYSGISNYNTEKWLTPFFNVQFLNSILMAAGLAVMNYLNYKVKLKSPVFIKKDYNNLTQVILPSLFLIVLFVGFFIEIGNYWDQAYFASSVDIAYEDGSGEVHAIYNYALRDMGNMWALNYTIIFFTLLSIINYKVIKNKFLGRINLFINTLVLVIFLFLGLYSFSELRDTYLSVSANENFSIGWFYIGIRYLSIGFLSALVYASYQYIKQEFMDVNLKQVFALVFYTTVLWLLSSELIHWMAFAGSTQSYKLGLSILWGVYSLVLIVIGIFRKYKQVRLGAMGLFGITLAKLFLYDISHLNTIAKTIVFVVLGVLLLIISFLYNKYKYLIFDENETEE